MILSRAAALTVFTTALASAQTLSTILPANNATGVPLNAQIIVAFSTGTYLIGSPVKLTKAGVAVPGTIRLPDAGGAVSPPSGFGGWYKFTPAKALDPNSRYDVEVDWPTGAPLLTSFTTGSTIDSAPPKLVSTEPAAGQTGVTSTTVLKFHFDKPLDPFSFRDYWFTLNAYNNGFSGSYAMDRRLDRDTVLIGTNNYVVPGDAYRLDFNPAGITDWLGNAVQSFPSLPFTSMRYTETDGPILTGSSPGEGEAAVPINSSVVVVFDKPVAKSSLAGVIQIDADGKAIPFQATTDQFGQGRAILLRPSILFPPNAQVTVTMTGLLDANGVAAPVPLQVHFRTGLAPDTRGLQVVNAPPSSIPRNGRILITFNRPISPVMLALGGLNVTNSYDPRYQNITPYQLSADRRTLWVSPNTPLPAGTFSTSLIMPWDTTANSGFYVTSGFTFSVTGDTDSQPPSVLGFNPSDGIADAPPSSSPIQVAFSEPVTVDDSTSPSFQLLDANGQPVNGTFSIIGTVGTFVPQKPLSADSGYTIQVSNIIDLAGNSLASKQAAFHTSTGPYVSPFALVSSDPPSNAANVAADATITLTFNRAVNPASVALSGAFICSATSLAVSGRFIVNGAVVTFVPDFALPPGAYSFYPGGITDAAGTPAGGTSIAFRVGGGAAGNGKALSVVSTSPSENGEVAFLLPRVLLRFSAPLNSISVNASNFTVYGTNGPVRDVKVALNSATEVAVSFVPTAGDVVTLYVNSSVADVYGNFAPPFRIAFRVSRPAKANAPPGVYVTPGNFSGDSSNVPPETGITVLFTSPVDRASVEQGAIFASADAFYDGRFEWAPDSTAFTFWPSSPLPYRASVNVVLASPAQDVNGNEIRMPTNYSGNNFAVADAPAPPSTSLALVASNVPDPFGNIPANSVLDLVFNADLPASAIHDATLKGGAETIACTVRQTGARSLRFTPQKAMTPYAYYTFEYDMGVNGKFNFFLNPRPPAAPNPDIIGFGPNDQAAPMNSRVVVAFANPVSHLPAATAIQLLLNGTRVPTRISWSPLSTSVTLSPLGLLAANTEYRVNVDGFEDMAGQPIPPRSWTFRTSSTTDLEAAALVGMTPISPVIGPHATFSFTYSKPVAASFLESFGIYASNNGSIDGRISMSGDQRVVYFTPSKPLPVGAILTWGQSSGGLVTANGFAFGPIAPAVSSGFQAPQSFRVSLDAGDSGAAPPSVTASTPPKGASDVPINSQIQVRFDQILDTGSLAGIQLLENGTPLAYASQLTSDGMTINVIPVRLLQPGASIRLIVSGVRNDSGTVMSGSWESLFNAGLSFANSAPDVLSSPGYGQTEVPLNSLLHIRFSRPLNALTVNAKTVILTLQGAGNVVSNATLEEGNRTITVQVPGALAANAAYTLALPGVTDLAGNAINGFAVRFYTSTGAGAKFAELVALDPPDGSTIIPDFALQALFSQPVDFRGGNASVSLTRADGSLVPTTIVPVAGGKLFAFKPVSTLADGVYELSLSNIADVSGSALPSARSRFTVSANAAATTALQLVSSSPASAAAAVPVNSTITLTFNRPVSAVKAAQLNLAWSGGAVSATVEVTGATVKFTPNAALPGATQILLTGSFYDLLGASRSVFLSFTTGAITDTTPPQLEFSSISDGTTISPAGTAGIVLRFSKPMIIPYQAIQFLSGSTPIYISSPFEVGEDGRTYTLRVTWPEKAHVLIASTPGVTDFAGNPITPFTIRFDTTAYGNSYGPSLISTIPADGAINVPVDQPVSLTFSQPMLTSSVRDSLRVVDQGVIASGAATPDSTNTTFTFQPDNSFGAGDNVRVYLPSPVASAAGVVTGQDIQFGFRTLSAAGTTAAVSPAAFNVSERSIDVRWDGLIDDSVCDKAYLSIGGMRVVAACHVVAADQAQWTVAEPLSTAATYRLVLDGTHEIAISPAHPRTSSQLPPIDSIETEAGGVRLLHFREPVNPLLLIRGAAGGFTMRVGVDGKTIRITPSRPGTFVIPWTVAK